MSEVSFFECRIVKRLRTRTSEPVAPLFSHYTTFNFDYFFFLERKLKVVAIAHGIKLKKDLA